MSESLAEKLRAMGQKQANNEKAEQDKAAFQERVNSFITDHARAAYQELLTALKTKMDEVNPLLGDLPKFEIPNDTIVQQGNCVASFTFTQMFTNLPNNRLVVGIGVHPSAIYFSESSRPQPVRLALQAAANDNVDSIVWLDDYRREYTASQLCETVLTKLTEYYLQHRPGNGS